MYAQLRSHAAPVYHDTLDAWLLASYADVDAAARNPAMVRTEDVFRDAAELARERAAGKAAMPNHARYVRVSLLDSDGAVHRRLRRLLVGEFSRAAVQRYRPVMEDHLGQLLDACLEQREFDFVNDLAGEVPGYIIGHVLGVPPADCPQLRVWSREIVQFFDADRTEAHARLAETATTAFAAYLSDLIAARRARPQGDLLSMLAAAQKRGELDETELISTAMLVLMAGHGSTIDALGTGLLALLQHPDEMVRLRRQPELMPGAVQEMFRYEAPLGYFHRFASMPVAMAGQRFPAGTKFGLLYGAANRDPAQFADADRLRVDRSPNRHVAFGRGAHLCLGNNLSRLDMEIFFDLLLARTADIQCMVTDPVYKRGIVERGLVALPVVVQPA